MKRKKQIKILAKEIKEQILDDQLIQENRERIKQSKIKTLGAVANLAFNTIEDLKELQRKRIQDKFSPGGIIHEPKQYPKVMYVWEKNRYNAVRRVVMMEKNGRFLAWVNAENLEEAESSMSIMAWNYAEDLIQVRGK